MNTHMHQSRSTGKWWPFAVKTGALTTICLLLAMASAASCPDAKVVEKAGNAMIAAAKAGSPSQFADAMRTYGDMDAITMFALGKHKTALPAARRGELVALTASFLARTFNDFRLKFRADSIAIEDCRDNTVRTEMRFLGQQGKQPVIWRIKNGRVSDVNVQNVWLAQLLRTEFSRIMVKNNGDINALIRQLKI